MSKRQKFGKGLPVLNDCILIKVELTRDHTPWEIYDMAKDLLEGVFKGNMLQQFQPDLSVFPSFDIEFTRNGVREALYAIKRNGKFLESPIQSEKP